MKNKLIRLSEKSFIRNIIIVASGTALAQIVTIALSPIITRLYGPEAFGLLGIFTAVVGILSPIAALSYPVAIVLPKSNNDANKLVRLSLYLTITVAIIALIILLFFNNTIASLFNIEKISTFLYLIPLVIIFSGILQVIQQWLIRTKQFRVSAKTEIYNSLLVNLSKIGVGLFLPIAASLILLQTLGIALRGILMHYLSDRSMTFKGNSNDRSELLKIASYYKDFPIYRSPQIFINTFSQKLPILLLTIFFGPVTSGFYLLGTQTMGAPVQLIGKSVQNVFYSRISEVANNGGEIIKVLIKTMAGLGFIGVVPFGFIVIFGPEIFSFIFGEEWRRAGYYVQWIAVLSFFTLITRPIISTIPIVNIQKEFLIFEVFGTIAKLISLILGFYLFNDDIIAVAIFSIVSVFIYIILIFYTLKAVKTFDSC
ncbi:oligosaccharide flippase family protein [Salinicoccus sp. RF5]|uniref:oligosaccharide flippase family protein n=1 Tax=Salinicoccus sp. RF5 TaxID=2748874 RepID=UPI001E5761A9|nr:oligosaccharide flippase family protein [Salinicoccus sp. RF5]MCC4722349.1 oligosaccharide flippase family protein [Salinicoccus sp. RF5]